MNGQLLRDGMVVCGVGDIEFTGGETDIHDVSSLGKPSRTAKGLRGPELVRFLLALGAIQYVQLPGEEYVLETEDGQKLRVMTVAFSVIGESASASCLVQERLEGG
jgi:hypothetical protein